MRKVGDDVTLTSTTIATTPTNQQRTLIGVAEEVDIATNPPTNVTWMLEGGGMLSQATGTTTTFTAPDVGSTCTITAGIANASQQASMITFTVIPPNGAVFTASNPFYHDNTIPSAGFTAKPIVIQPTTVSFYNIEVREGTGKAVAIHCAAPSRADGNTVPAPGARFGAGWSSAGLSKTVSGSSSDVDASWGVCS
jgi:hypothetical protein